MPDPDDDRPPDGEPEEPGEPGEPEEPGDPTQAVPRTPGAEAQPVWADDLTTALTPVPPPPEDEAATTWISPVRPDAAPTRALTPTPPPAEPVTGEAERPGGLTGGRIALIVGLVVLAAVLIGVAAFVLTGGDDDTVEGRPVALRAATDPGPAPFTVDVAERVDLDRVRQLSDIDEAIEEPDDGAGDPADATRTGTDPGLYGAVRGSSLCDRGRLARDLEGAPSTLAAWAGIAGVAPGDAGAFLDRLTPVVLLDDTRITDHDDDAGRAVPVQAILQAGTAVLVDDRGLPRVRCPSGSPLLPPVRSADGIRIDDAPWPGFSLDRVQAVRPGTAVSVLVLIDLASGEPFSRPVGTDGADDAPIGVTTTTTETTTTTAPTTTAPTTTTTTEATTTTAPPPEPTEVTAAGSVTASSEADPSFAADRAIDGNVATSWFGTGSQGEPIASVFTWEHDDVIEIARITVVGNGAHQDSALRTGTGFESVTVEVLADGSVTYSETFGLPGTPDPTINARPAAPGNTVRLTFTGAEGPSRAGFAELTVVGVA